MIGRAAVLLLSMAVACTPGQEQGRMAQPAAARVEAASPVLLRYLPPERGGPSAYPEAIVSGTLDLSGPCVRFQDPHGRITTVVSSPGPYLGQDGAGRYVKAANERLRHGSSVTGGGGWFDNFPGGLGQLDGPVPAQCRSGPFVVVTGMRRDNPADRRPPRSPPPPPQN